MDKLQKVQEALEGLRSGIFPSEEAVNELIEEALAELKEFREGSVDDKLWQLLDDIDTASDIFKPEQTDFYKYVMAKAQERHRYLVSDGFNLRHRNET